MLPLLSLALSAPVADAKWLIIQEACCADSHDVLSPALTALGVTADVQTGATVGARTAADLFANYEVVFIGVGSAGQQITDADVKPLIRTGGVVDQYVALGGILMIHGAHNDAQDVTGPGDSRLRIYLVSAATDDNPTITDSDNEFITGQFAGGVRLTNTDFRGWTSTCHGAVDPPPGYPRSGGVNLGTSPVDSEWNEILFSPANNDSAMLEYTYGCGYVLIDMMTFDWAGSALRDALVPEAAAYIHGIEGNFPSCNGDKDLDTILDDDDNCVEIPNLDQADGDSDGIGDVCDPCDGRVDPDSDGDGVCDSADICPNGSDFTDGDGDGVADGCDPCPLDRPDDPDGDGVCTAVDECLAGDDGIDTDIDGVPDACDHCVGAPDIDTDGDGVCNFFDVCPGADDHLDTDGDGVANGCDACPLDRPDDLDGDGVCNSDDACPNFDDNIDADADGMPDLCDICPLSALNDSDGDGVCNDVDACPGFDDTADRDHDALADGCDPCPRDAAGSDDDDADGTCNSDDRCTGFDDFADLDGDLLADGCDNCPLAANPTQADADGDTFGTACDCDDASADIRPNAVEVCDGLDNDCDDAIDEAGAIGPIAWFEDADGDGQGAKGTLVNGCQQPENTSVNNTDCDDTNPLVYVGAPEWCDGRDTNCDGQVDEGGVCPEAVELDPDATRVTSCGGCEAAGGANGSPVGAIGLVLAGAAVLRRRR
jgi:MYXO-CTERM domain-containing protein